MIVLFSLGDSLYPGKGVCDESETDVLYDFEHTGTFKNRMHFSKSGFGRIGCNVSDPNGHMSPIDLKEVNHDHLKSSKL